VIVISGALVVVALVLLVIGLVIAGLGWVYGSIAVSLLSFVFLVIGILQRRKEVPGAEAPALAGAGTGAVAAGVGALVRAGDRLVGDKDGKDGKVDDATVTTLPSDFTPPAAPTVAVTGVAGEVLVVAGRPRYHVAGCRYLTGKDAESVAVADARAQGFTACGVCKPDDALASAAPAGATGAIAAAEPVDAIEVTELVAAEPVVAAPVRTAARARTATKAPAKKAAPAKTAAKPATKPATKTTARAASAAGTAAKKAPAKTAAKAAPAKTAAKAAPAKKATPAKTAAKAAPAKKAGPAKKAPAKKAPAKGA
jgi:hypothetical protein